MEEVKLTQRRQEILDDILDGLSDEDIARKRFIEKTTVKTHLLYLFKKFQVNSRSRLIAKIYKEKINRIRQIVNERLVG